MAVKQGYRSRYKKCPYWRGTDDQRQTIRCEGIGEASSLELVYTGVGCKAARIKQERLYCESVSGCRYCEVYRMIEANKYDE